MASRGIAEWDSGVDWIGGGSVLTIEHFSCFHTMELFTKLWTIKQPTEPQLNDYRSNENTSFVHYSICDHKSNRPIDQDNVLLLQGLEQFTVLDALKALPTYLGITTLPYVLISLSDKSGPYLPCSLSLANMPYASGSTLYLKIVVPPHPSFIKFNYIERSNVLLRHSAAFESRSGGTRPTQHNTTSLDSNQPPKTTIPQTTSRTPLDSSSHRVRLPSDLLHQEDDDDKDPPEKAGDKVIHSHDDLKSKLEEWSTTTTGEWKDIRVLLSTLNQVNY